ncbi:MAG TPA: TadE family protein [Methylophilaceae bacterium]|nr:TadE family protein [Methylophilaceae bacterium]
MRAKQQLQLNSRQAGAAAIEFALLFALFFVIFYALVSYAVAMLIQQSFTHAAAEGARAAVAVNPLEFSDTEDFRGAVNARVENTVNSALAWLPEKAKTAVAGEKVSWSGDTLTVRIEYRDYGTSAGLLPVLQLPMIGNVPNLPKDLIGSASITL